MTMLTLLYLSIQFSFENMKNKLQQCVSTVPVSLLVFWKDVCVAFSSEASMLSDGWHALWSITVKGVRVSSGNLQCFCKEWYLYVSVNCGIYNILRCAYCHSEYSLLEWLCFMLCGIFLGTRRKTNSLQMHINDDCLLPVPNRA